MSSQLIEKIYVQNADELLTALESAKGGEEIVLGSGHYGALDLYAPRALFATEYTENVTIVSADAENPAVFDSLKLTGISNLTFDSIKFDYTYEEGQEIWHKPFSLAEVDNVTIKNSIFDGDLAHENPNSESAYGFGVGLNVRDSTNVTVDGNDFFDFHRGAVFSSVENLIIQNNDIHDMRSDGFDFVEVENVEILYNHFHDFKLDEESNDHPDMIQFWTTGSSSPSQNILIKGNILNSGEGGGTQSIFMRNESVDTGLAGEEMFYQNIVIEDNLIHNSHIHGISIGESNGLTVSNNTLIQNTNTEEQGSVSEPSIRVADGSKSVIISKNIASNIVIGDEVDLISYEENVIIQNDFINEENYVENLFFDATGGRSVQIEDLQIIPDSVINLDGIGSSYSNFNETPDSVTAMISKQKMLEIGDNIFQFDATFSAGPNGSLNSSNTSYHWDFGDGNTSDAPVVQHQYTGYGEFEVTLTITDENGDQSQNKTIVQSLDPLLLKLDFSENAVVDSSIYSSDISYDVDSYLVGEGVSGQALKLLDKQAITVDRTNKQLFEHDRFSYDFDIKKEEIDGSGGELFRIHTALYVSVTDDGEISVLFNNHENVSFSLNTSGADISDTDWHKVTLTFDGYSEKMTVFVDAVEVGSVEATGMSQASEYWGLMIGSLWGNSFDGYIDNFEMRSDVLSQEDISTRFTDMQEALAPTLLQLDFQEDQVVDTSAFNSDISYAADHYLTVDGVNGSALKLQDFKTVTVDRENTQIFEHNKFTYDFLLRKDAIDGSGGEIFRIHTALYVSVTNDNEISVKFNNHENETFTVTTVNAGIDNIDWHKVTLVFDGEAEKLAIYVDGQELASSYATGTSQGAEYWGLMLGNLWGKSYDGYVDQFVMRADAMSASEILSDYQSLNLEEVLAPESLERTDVEVDSVLLKLQFDESGVKDLSSHKSEISYLNDAYLLDHGVGGLGLSLQDYQTVTVDRENTQLFGHEQFSYDFSLKQSGVSGGGGEIFRIHTAIYVSVTDSGEISVKFNNDSDETFILETNGAGIDDSQWHKVALTFDSSEEKMSIFVDAVEVGTIQATGMSQAAEYWGLMIGNPWGKSFDGIIDDFEMRSDVLTHEQIQTRYNEMLSTLEEDSIPIVSLEGLNVLNEGEVTGTDQNDYLIATSDDDTIDGGNGDDYILGGAGDDFIHGSDGADVLLGESGNDIFTLDLIDQIFGGSGFDTLKIEDNELDSVTLSDVLINSIEQLDMRNSSDDNLILGLEDVLQSDTQSLTVIGNTGDTLTIKGDVMLEGQIVMDDRTLNEYSYSSSATSATLFVDTDIEIK